MLALLAARPSTSHELGRRLEAEIGAFWEWPGPSLVNNLVKNLHERLGVVDIIDEDERGRAVYKLAQKGTVALDRWRHETDAVPPPRRPAAPPR